MADENDEKEEKVAETLKANVPLIVQGAPINGVYVPVNPGAVEVCALLHSPLLS